MDRTSREANERAAFFNARLDEIRMSGHQRLKAKAQLAQAEAIADAIVGAANLVKGLLKILVLRPYRHLTASIG